MPNPLSPTAKISFLRSIRTSLFVQAALLVALTVLLMVSTAFWLARTEITQSAFLRLRLLASGKEDVLETTLSRQRRQVSILAAEEGSLITSESVRQLLGLQQLLLHKDGETMMPLVGGTGGTIPLEDINPHVFFTDQTQFLPLFAERSMPSYIIAAPLRTGTGVVEGSHLLAVFDAYPLFSRALDNRSSGAEADISLVVPFDDAPALLRTSDDETLSLYEPHDGAVPVLLSSLKTRTDVARTVDYSGVPALAAYNSLPSLGWGMIVTTDESNTYAPIRRLALSMFGGGFVIIVISVIVVWSMAARITSPLRSLQKKLQKLETKQWHFPRSIFTGNELEIVDAAAFDLTERLRDSYEHLEDKVAERTKELSEAYAKDEAILSSMEHGVVVTDENGIVIAINAAAASLTGWTKDAASGAAHHDVLPLLDKEEKPLPATLHPVAQVLATGEKFIPVPDPGFLLTVKDSQKHRPVTVVATPVLRDTHCIGTVIVFRDVTHDRRIDRMKSEFITLASHQLRTPLSSIRWNTEMLIADDAKGISNEQRDLARNINASTMKMIRVVSSLIDVANLELGKVAVHMEENVDLVLFLSKIEETFAQEIAAKNISVVRTVPNEVPKKISTDLILLRLILENLTGNAVKYSREGGTVELRIEFGKAQKQLILSVTDQGIGVPVTAQQRIFEKLFRADNAKEIDPEGSGLGLYISKMAAEAIGATLSFKSEEGKGSVFTLTLPIGGDAAAPRKKKEA